jgi:hypothetical protein
MCRSDIKVNRGPSPLKKRLFNVNMYEIVYYIYHLWKQEVQKYL